MPDFLSVNSIQFIMNHHLNIENEEIYEGKNNQEPYKKSVRLRFGGVQKLVLELETGPLTEPFRMH